jgi:hypothetical protein
VPVWISAQPRALGGGGTGRECVGGLGDGPAGTAVDKHRIGGDAGFGIEELHARPLGGEVLVAPGEQRDEHRAKITSARGRHIFVARRALAVEPALEQPGLHEAIEPPGQHVGSDAEALLEFVEAPQPVQGVAQDEDAPPLAHMLEAAGDRAGHGIEACALH